MGESGRPLQRASLCLHVFMQIQWLTGHVMGITSAPVRHDIDINQHTNGSMLTQKEMDATHPFHCILLGD